MRRQRGGGGGLGQKDLNKVDEWRGRGMEEAKGGEGRLRMKRG